MSNPVINHLITLARTEPVEAGYLFVQSATARDEKDPTYLPWSVPTALRFAQSTLLLTDEQVDGVRDRLRDEGWLFCDLCSKAEHSDDLTPDWNGDTGNHLSCEARLVTQGA